MHSRRRPPIRLVLCLSACLVPALVGYSVARACLSSQVPSAYADGIAARVVTTQPAGSATPAPWAPFAFPQPMAPGHRVHLREDMAEVAQSLGRAALRWRVRWLFGDGTRAMGVAVIHTYRRPGIYRITVQSYEGQNPWTGWYTFDLVDVTVSAPLRHH